MNTIEIGLTQEQYRTLLGALNDAEDLARANGYEVPLHMHQLLKQLLIAGLKAGWSKLPSCFTGDDEIIAAAGEREFPDPNTKH